MRIIDTCGYIGNWPFRRLTRNTAEEVDKLMQELGADTLFVASSDAICYKNPQDGNEALFEALDGKNFATKFLKFAVIRPGYPGWKHDIDVCIKELGFFGLEIAPMYHDLTQTEMAEFYAYASELGVPVRINTEFENWRQHHRLDDHRVINAGMLVPMLKAGDAPLIVNSLSGPNAEFGEIAKARGNIFVDINRVDSFASNSLEYMAEVMGTDALCVGTRAPFSYGDGNLVKIMFTKMFSDEDREKIAWKNISKIIK
ncbi:MAG: hypothetical protein IJC88_04570 [Oscillospiraceae bacterium]|nr:hypothetical protein [Oscillospiraceae bacterium]